MIRLLLHLDRVASSWIAAQFSAPALQWLLLPFTVVGYGGLVWLGLAGLGWWMAPRLVSAREDMRSTRLEVAGMRAACWRACMAVLVAATLAEGVAKPLVSRERPFVHGPAPSAIVWRPTTASFPSGHAATAAAGALALSRAWPPAAVPLAILASLVALSRVGLGVHYVGDVVAGLLLGILAASLAAPRIPRLSRGRHPVIPSSRAAIR